MDIKASHKRISSRFPKIISRLNQEDNMMDTSNMVFCFGSNEAGQHGAGAARHALLHRGALMGCGFGHTRDRQGRESFAIPTKNRSIKHTLDLKAIQHYVNGFLTYAGGRPDLQFQVTCIGCGLAGLKHEDVAPLFRNHPSNCYFDLLWQEYLPAGTRFWGTL